MSSVASRSVKANGHVGHKTARTRKQSATAAFTLVEPPAELASAPVAPAQQLAEPAPRRFVRIGSTNVPRDADPALVMEWFPRHIAALHVAHCARALQAALWNDESIGQVMNTGARYLLQLEAERGGPIAPFEDSHRCDQAENRVVSLADVAIDEARASLIAAAFEALRIEGAITETFDTTRLDDPIGVQSGDWLVWLTPRREDDGSESIEVQAIELGSVELLAWGFED